MTSFYYLKEINPSASPNNTDTSLIGNGSMVDPTGKASRRRFAILAILVAVVATIIVPVGIWFIRSSHERQRLQMTRESFMLTWMSLQCYDEGHGHLPFPVRRETVGKPTRPGMPNGQGKPLYSWRGEVALYRDSWFGGDSGRTWDPSASWNDPANSQLANFPWQFCYDALVTWEWPAGHSKETSQMAITGPGTAFGCEEESPKSLREIEGSTILVVETRNSGIHWMQPGDFDIRSITKTINAPDGSGISSRYPAGFHVLFADGKTWFLSEQIPFDTLQKFFTVDGAKKHDREELLGPFVLARFPH